METLNALLAHPLAGRFGWSLAHFVWQGAVLAAVLAVALHLLRKRSPDARYLACSAALLLMTAAVPLTMCLLPQCPAADSLQTDGREPAAQPPLHEISRHPAMMEESGFGAPRPGFGITLSETTEPSATQSATAAPESSGPWRAELVESANRLMPWAVVAWLAGVLVLSIRLTAGWIVVQRLKRRCVEPLAVCWTDTIERLRTRLAISRPVRVLQASLAEVPSTIGWLRPVILLPASAMTGLSPEQLEAIIAHELAHIRRHDYLVNLIQSAVETLLFYHPAVWWVSRRMRVEREHCCDDLAIAVCGDALTYARALSEMESMRGSSRLLAAATGGVLVDRVRRILGIAAPGRDSFARWTAGLLVTAVVTAFAVAVELSAARAVADDSRAASPAASAPADEPPEMAAQPHHWRRFVRIVVGPESMAFEGEPAEWSRVDELLSDIHEPEHTVLELAWSAEDLADQRKADAERNAAQLVTAHELEYLSLVGVHPLVSKGSKPHYLPPLTQRGRWRHFATLVVLKDAMILDATPAGAADYRFSLSDVDLSRVTQELPEPQWTVLELVGEPEALTPELQRKLRAEGARAGFEDVVLATDANPKPSRFVRDPNQPGYWRHDVTLVVGPDRMTFQGEPVTIEQLGPKLEAVGDKADTVLCIAATSDEINREEVRRRLHTALQGVKFNHISWVGVHPFGTKGGPSVFFAASTAAASQAADGPSAAGITARLLSDPGRAGPTLHLTMPGEMLKSALNDELAGTFKLLLEGEPSLKFDTPANKPMTVTTLVNAGKAGLLSGTVVYLRSKNIFYVWGYDTFSSKAPSEYRFYGPFPADALKQLDWKKAAESGSQPSPSTMPYEEKQVLIPTRGIAPTAAPPTTQPATGSVSANRFLPRGPSSRPADGSGEGGPAGVVLTPDGEPAANALVVIIPPRTEGFAFSCQFLNGSIGDARNSLATQTGADGRFAFGEQEAAFQLVVLHDSGFAHVTMEAFEASSSIRLAAWARIEGRVLIGGKPGNGEKAVLERRLEDLLDPAIAIRLRNEAMCDDQGRFVMEHVVPIRSFVGREVTVARARSASMVFDHAVAIEPKPGKTAAVTIGGTGHKVTGRVLGADGKPADFSKTYALGQLNPPMPRLTPPPGVAGTAQETRAVTIPDVSKWLASDEGKAFQQAYTRASMVAYCVPINDDGTFSVDDVPAGDYTLSVWVRQLHEGPAWGVGETIGMVNSLVAVDAEPGAVAEPLDLGTFDLKPPSTPGKPGRAATGGPDQNSNPGSTVNAEAESREERIDELVGLLKSPDQLARKQAVRELGEMKDRRVVPGLILALRDDDGTVRSRASSYLIQIADPSAVEPLVACLEKDTDARVRANAAAALGRLAGEASVTALVPALRDDGVDVRKAAARSLRDLGWEPRDSNQRIWFALGLGEMDKAAGIARKVEVDAGKMSARGAFALDVPAIVRLQAAAQEASAALEADWIEFVRAEDRLLARLAVRYPSGPKARWRAIVQLLDGKGQIVGEEGTLIENSGVIAGTAILMQQTLRIDLGAAKALENTGQFRVSIGSATNESLPEKADLDPPAILTGVVTDPAGKPLAGVKVHAYTGLATWFPLHPKSEFLTDDQGRYRIEVRNAAGCYNEAVRRWDLAVGIRLERAGYQTAGPDFWTGQVAGVAGRATSQDFQMAPTPSTQAAPSLSSASR